MLTPIAVHQPSFSDNIREKEKPITFLPKVLLEKLVKIYMLEIEISWQLVCIDVIYVDDDRVTDLIISWDDKIGKNLEKREEEKTFFINLLQESISAILTNDTTTYVSSEKKGSAEVIHVVLPPEDLFATLFQELYQDFFDVRVHLVTLAERCFSDEDQNAFEQLVGLCKVAKHCD